MNETNNIIPILELKEVHSINVCLNESEITQIREIIQKLNVKYIYKVLVLSAFLYDCNPNDVLKYDNKSANTKDRKRININHARYLWISLLLNVGFLSSKDVCEVLELESYQINHIIAKFKEKAVFGTLLFDKYNAAREILLAIK